MLLFKEFLLEEAPPIKEQDALQIISRECGFEGCRSPKREGKRRRLLPFDFYIPHINLCIEYDGRQHYEPVYGEEQLKIQKENDSVKNNYCTGKNGRPRLLRISYKEDIEKTLNNIIQ